MLSSVVQNFLTTTPFNVKTARYHLQVKALNTRLVGIFIKSTTYFSLVSQGYTNLNQPTKVFYTSQFLTPFWVSFKKLYFRKQGLYSNNLLLSALGLSIENLSVTINNPKVYGINAPMCLSTPYLRPVQVFTFSFHNKIYNTLVWYIFNLLTHSYVPTTTTYNLNYSFLFVRSNTALYSFINLFYLKVRNF